MFACLSLVVTELMCVFYFNFYYTNSFITFLPCILLGLSQAPLLSVTDGVSVDNLDFLVMPYDALGSVPVFEALKRNIPVYAVKENSTVLNVTNRLLFKSDRIIEAATYQECLDLLTQA